MKGLLLLTISFNYHLLGDWLVMRALMWQGVSINTQRQHVGGKGVQHELHTPLIAAAAHGQVDLLKNILSLPELEIDAVNLVGNPCSSSFHFDCFFP